MQSKDHYYFVTVERMIFSFSFLSQVTWLASWNENIQGATKYVMLNAASKLKVCVKWELHYPVNPDLYNNEAL